MHQGRKHPNGRSKKKGNVSRMRTPQAAQHVALAVGVTVLPSKRVAWRFVPFPLSVIAKAPIVQCWRCCGALPSPRCTGSHSIFSSVSLRPSWGICPLWVPSASNTCRLLPNSWSCSRSARTHQGQCVNVAGRDCSVLYYSQVVTHLGNQFRRKRELFVVSVSNGLFAVSFATQRREAIFSYSRAQSENLAPP